MTESMTDEDLMLNAWEELADGRGWYEMPRQYRFEVFEAGWKAASTQPQQWIKCSDRLPVEKDGDYKNMVWVCELGDRDPFVWSLKTLVEYKISHPEYEFWWTPTNLKRPEPPKE